MGFLRELGNRFKEPSTFAGIAAGAALLHGNTDAVIHGAATVAGAVLGATNPITIGVGVIGALASIFLPEKGGN